MVLPFSRYDLAQRGHLQRLEMVADRVRDEARGDRRAVVVKDRHQADRIDAAFVDDERANSRSRFSTTNTKSWSATKLVTLEWNGKARTRRPVERVAASIRWIASSIAGEVEPVDQLSPPYLASPALACSGRGMNSFAVSNLRMSRCMLSASGAPSSV